MSVHRGDFFPVETMGGRGEKEHFDLVFLSKCDEFLQFVETIDLFQIRIAMSQGGFFCQSFELLPGHECLIGAPACFVDIVRLGNTFPFDFLLEAFEETELVRPIYFYSLSG